MSFTFPRSGLRDLCKRDVQDCDHYEPFDSSHCGNVQRNELAVGKREFVAVPGLEKSVPCRVNIVQHGAAPWNSLRSVLQGKLLLNSTSFFFFFPYRHLLQTVFSTTPLNWEEWKTVIYLSAPVLVLEEVLKLISVRILPSIPLSRN